MATSGQKQAGAEKESFWQRHVSTCQACSLSAIYYCQAHDLTLSTGSANCQVSVKPWLL
jgi:hypothetical protein